MEPLFLKPVFQEKIWGGSKLAKQFHYNLPSENIGECWAISAHPNGESIVTNGIYENQKLSTLWKNMPSLFDDYINDSFPLLTKILDAEDDLSVQVHPNNAYAKVVEHELGKTECWYIISAEPGAHIIYGHNAQTPEQLEEMIDTGDWQHLLRKKYVHAGDFIYVPSGTVHALSKGIVALETQQNSDTTYRIYDYDRVDDQGNKRELHLKKALDVIKTPFEIPDLKTKIEKIDDNEVINYIRPPQSPYFAVWGMKVNSSLEWTHQIGSYTLFSVIGGVGELEIGEEVYTIDVGDHFIIPAQIADWRFNGEKLHLIASEAR